MGLILGLVKSAQFRQWLATAATFLCSACTKSRRWAPVVYARKGSGVNTPPPDDCRKNENFLNCKTNRLFFVRSLLKLLSCFFCSVQLSNLFSRNFHYDAMQRNRYSNFSDAFCLNCNVVIDAAVKQLVSIGISVHSAHNFFLKIESNLHCTLPPAVVPNQSMVASGGARPRGLAPGQHTSEETSQRWRAVA